MTTITRMGFIPQDVINPENVHAAQPTGHRRTDRGKKWRAGWERRRKRRKNKDADDTHTHTHPAWVVEGNRGQAVPEHTPGQVL